MTNLTPTIFKAYDIRGVYPTEINEENSTDIVKAIYTFFQNKIQKNSISIVLGRDARISSPTLHKVVVDTLVNLGAHVTDLGIVPTPTVYFASLYHKTDAGIQISASHNPKEYNGFKFFYTDNGKIVKVSKITGMDDVKNIALEKRFATKTSKGSHEESNNILDKEIENALPDFNIKTSRKIKIVADPANAVGALIIDKLARKFDIELVKMNFDLDGNFPNHQADPLQFKLLKPLQERVIKEKADFGIAPDGDADRVFFVDEKGSIIPATIITSLIAEELLKQYPHEKVLVDVRYINNVIDVCKKNNGIAVLSKVGHALITEQLNRENCIFAGESSGHYYFRKNGGAESSIRVMLHVLQALTTEKKALSEILNRFYISMESGEYNYRFAPTVSIQEFIAHIKNIYNTGDINTLDGIAITYPNWRFSIRTSNTEPLLRLNIESNSLALTQEKQKELSDLIQKYGGKIHT